MDLRKKPTNVTDECEMVPYLPNETRQQRFKRRLRDKYKLFKAKDAARKKLAYEEAKEKRQSSLYDQLVFREKNREKLRRYREKKTANRGRQ